MGAKLEDLNRDLSESTTCAFPEEYVKKTLLAHGFLSHHNIFEEHKKKAQESEKALKEGITEEEKRRTTQLIYHFKEGKEFHSLKEPLNLIRRNQSLPHKVAPLWPAEVDCISYRCHFLWDVPASPEPFYVPETPVLSPKIRSSLGEGTIVYSNTHGPEKYFTKARQGPNLSVPHKRQRQHGSTNLIFESRFESGNLAKVIQVGRWDYELYLRFDLYTQKHTQWFYFNVQNMRAGQTYRFTIVNLYKPSSLYNVGMQPLMYSERKAEWNHIGWRRVGFNIKYFKTDIRRWDTNNELYYYALTWSYTFPFDNDVCYFSHCYPYTYTDLQEYLHSIAIDPVKSKFCKQRTLCHSIAGNPVPLLTITSPSTTPDEAQTKKAVVVTARVHPGETNSSWMMKGLIDLLTSDAPDAEILRDAFVFKIIPMLNPDGVIVGNYRCSLTGRDLNRNYRTKLPDAYPTIWYAKEFVKKLSEERKIAIYCDLHGHSRKQNVFIYGCDNVQDSNTRLKSRVFPMMLSRNIPDKFSYESCSFKVQKTKEGTGRVYMWREMGILNSYTMEATFCGSSIKGLHFSIRDFEEMGYHFCDTLLDYCDPDQSKANQILTELTDDYRQTLIAKLTELGVELPLGVDPLDIQLDLDIYSDVDSSDAGSDSSDSDGPPVLGKYHTKKRKHKKLQSRKERNKQKARIKLTHKLNQQTPQHLTKPTQFKEEPKKIVVDLTVTTNITQDQTSPMSVISSSTSTCGIPKHLPERMEARVNKEFGDDINKSKSIEAVTADYMRSGLPHNISLDANKELVSSTASFLSTRTHCPIAITPKVLQTPSQTKLGSKSMLPQLPLSIATASTSLVACSNGGGTFAKNYVVNHLQEPTANEKGGKEQMSDLSMGGSTQNLVNLSKLFRQLKPHLLSSQSQKERGFTNGYHNDAKISSTSSHDTFSSASQKMAKTEEKRKGTPHPVMAKSLSGSISTSYISKTRSKEELSQEPTKLVSLPAATNKVNKPVSTTGLSTSKSSLTSSDLVVVDAIRQSYGSLMEMDQKQKAVHSFDNISKENDTYVAETLNKTENEPLLQPLLQLSQPPITALEWQNSIDHEHFDIQANNNQRKDEEDESLYKNRYKNSLVHKREISDAVEALKLRKKKLFKNSFSDHASRPQTTSEISSSQKTNPLGFTYTHPQTQTNKFSKPQTNFSRPNTSTGSTRLSRSLKNFAQSHQNNHPLPHAQTSESRIILSRVQSSSGRKAKNYSSTAEHYKMYSSNIKQSFKVPPSNGIVPATVSLTLSSNNQRPVSQHSPRPLKLRYY